MKNVISLVLTLTLLCALLAGCGAFAGNPDTTNGTGSASKNTGEDVTIVADLSDYAVASGTYMVPAQVEVDGRVGVSGTYQVQIRIPEAQE